MPSLADNLLAAGAVAAIEAVHGEQVVVLSGADAGRTFTAVCEIVSDVVLNEVTGPDVRAKRVLRFRNGSVPMLAPVDVISTDDGKRWRAVRAPQDGYLTTDFELTELTAKDA